MLIKVNLYLDMLIIMSNNLTHIRQTSLHQQRRQR
nr:MAG TPA: hypothetical protein [Caudoviricetes sp.]